MSNTPKTAKTNTERSQEHRQRVKMQLQEREDLLQERHNWSIERQQLLERIAQLEGRFQDPKYGFENQGQGFQPPAHMSPPLSCGDTSGSEDGEVFNDFFPQDSYVNDKKMMAPSAQKRPYQGIESFSPAKNMHQNESNVCVIENDIEMEPDTIYVMKNGNIILKSDKDLEFSGITIPCGPANGRVPNTLLIQKA
ncbi:hypothetical protein L596_025775 [Steinernema carpocapsae]|uniref:BZIP domain-containing protein n=1 Tax=Steinernema carpocapsae TaxID=34508 RepID=A0A4U5M900_STECR|nr:hypothetical protein L596_025775 [Steinernema carpocapsae]